LPAVTEEGVVTVEAVAASMVEADFMEAGAGKFHT